MAEYIESLSNLAEKFGRLEGVGKKTAMRMAFSILELETEEAEDFARAILDAKEYEITAGGGVVTIKINGKKEVLSIDIKPEIVDPDDIETLTDTLVAGINEAIKKVEDTNKKEMEKITGNINMPGLF